MKSLTLALSITALAACGGDNSNPDENLGPMRAVVVAGDFAPGAPGVLSAVDPGTNAATKNASPQGSVDSDPLIRRSGAELFVINRGANNITVLSAKDYSLVEQLSTGAGSNPQDVAVVGDKLYVPTYGGKGVVVLTRGTSDSAEIDLSADDPDGKPDCNSIYNVDGKLYVACGLLDGAFSPRGPGKVYVVDSKDDSVTATITLSHKNPIAFFERDAMTFAGDLVIPTVEFDANNAGCIERVTVGPSPAARGCVTDNTALGGFPNRVAFGSDHVLYAAVNLNDFTSANLQKLDGTPVVISAATEHVGDVAGCPDGTIVVSDRTMGAAGIRIFDGATEKTTAQIDVGLPPAASHGLLCY